MNAYIQEMIPSEIDQVSGGIALCNNVSSCLSLAVNVAAAVAATASWLSSKSAGGADETTWTNVGASQMGA